jgi:uncharacterized OB-fold protein
VPPSRPIAAGLFDIVDGIAHLRASRCDACAHLQFPACDTCPYCGSATSTPTFVGPGGTLRLFTAVSARPPGYRGPLPFGFGVVELDGAGLQVITRLTEPDPDRLHVGQHVRLVLEPLCTDDDGTTVVTYAFAPEPTT